MIGTLLAGAALGGMAATHLLQTWRGRTRRDLHLPDLLSWGPLVDDGIIYLKDGGFLASLDLAGPDRASISDEALRQFATTLQSAFGDCEDRWGLYFDALRSPAPDYPNLGHFPEAATALLDDERRSEYLDADNLVTTTVLSVTYHPPPQAEQRLSEFLVERTNHRLPSTLERSLDLFRTTLEGLKRTVAPFEPRRLSSSRLLSHLSTCLVGRHDRIEAPPPGFDADVANLIAPYSFLGGYEPHIDHREIRVIAVAGYPGELPHASWDRFNSLPFPARSSHRILPLSNNRALSLLGATRRGWYKRIAAKTVDDPSQHSTNHELLDDPGAIALARDGAEAIGLLRTGDGSFASLTWNVVLHAPEGETDPDRFDGQTHTVIRSLREIGLVPRLETTNAIDATFGSLPGHGSVNVRRPLIQLEACIATLPITRPWAGHPHSPNPYLPSESPPLAVVRTDGRTPYHLNLHTGDLGHTLVIGPSGTGKSVLLGLIAAQHLRYPNSRVFFFDKTFSVRFLAHAAQAGYYDFGAENVRLQPLRLIHQTDELQVTYDWLLSLFSLQGAEPTPNDLRDLREALNLLAQRPQEDRTLANLHGAVQVESLRQAIEPYCPAGPYGGYLDANTESLRDGQRFQVFEIGRLLDADSKPILVPVLLHLLRSIRRSLDESAPTLIIIDEAHAPLRDETFSTWIAAALLEFRKLNATVVLATQEPAHVLNNSESTQILASAERLLLLPFAGADASHRSAYKALGLTRAECRLLASATPKRQYLHRTPDGTRLLDLSLGRLALGLLAPPQGVTVAETAERTDHYRSTYGSRWLEHWLADHGLEDYVEHYRSISRDFASSNPDAIRDVA